MKKLLLFIILLPTILMADAVIFSGNDVKALKQNLDLFGVVKVMSGSVDPSAGAGVAAPQGSAYLSTVHGLFLKTGVANTAWTKNSLLPVDLTSQVTGVLPIANGGTGSATQNFVDLTTNQTIGGTKTFSSTIQGDISGNSATVTTNANLTGDVTSIGNTTSYNNVVPVAKGGTGSATQNFVDLTTNQTVAGNKTWTGTHTFNNTISGSITGNAATVTTNANLTGAVTSVGNATSLGSFTSSNLSTALADETGSGAAVFATSPTLTTPNIGAATGTSLELSGAFNSSLISAINMLPNGNVELTDISMFSVGAGNAKARTTTSGEFSSNTAALKITTTAATLDVSQSVNTPSGIQKQGFLRIIYRIPPAVTDAQICTVVDTVEQSCVPSSRLLNNGLFNSIEVPLVFGSTSVGWKAKTTATNSQDFFFDGMVIGQGLGMRSIDSSEFVGKVTYGATSGCTWETTSTSWSSFSADTDCATPVAVGNVSIPGTKIPAIVIPNYKPGRYLFQVVAYGSMAQSDVAGKGGLRISDGTNVGAEMFSSNAFVGGVKNAVHSSTYTGSITNTTTQSNVTIQMQGFTTNASNSMGIYVNSSNNFEIAVYYFPLNSPVNVYSQASGNYSRRPYTPTFTGFGTVTGVDCYESRDGEYNVIDCAFTSGTSTTTEARVSLPGSNVTSSLSGARLCGDAGKNSSSSTYFRDSVICEPSVGYVTFGTQTNGTNAITKALASQLISSGQVLNFTARVPIQGWSNANAIVGSFENVVTTPNISQPKTYSFRVTTTTGVVDFNYGGLISSCTAASPTVCTFNSNKLTVTPNCSSGVISSNAFVRFSSASSTGITIEAQNASNAGVPNTPAMIVCHGY